MSKPRSILVVDDEDEILSALKTHLEIKGYEVSTANSGDDALKQLETRAFDVICMDINMPKMDGLELLEAAKAKRGEIVPIMMTAYTSISKVLMSRTHGAFDYILKPFADLSEIDQIMVKVQQHIERWENILVETRDEKRRKAS